MRVKRRLLDVLIKSSPYSFTSSSVIRFGSRLGYGAGDGAGAGAMRGHQTFQAGQRCSGWQPATPARRTVPLGTYNAASSHPPSPEAA